jgi:serralysin
LYKNAVGKNLMESSKAQASVGSANGRTCVGTSLNELFNSASGDTLLGGLGDDTYNLWSSSSRVVERANEGIDTAVVKFWGGATLTDNVENLVLDSAGATAGTGNALDNIIVAGKVGATLDGRRGNDVLVGGAGSDLFKVSAGNGSDAIVGFTSGRDAIKLDGYKITSFSELLSFGKQVGADATFSLPGGEKLVVRDVQLNTLHGYDFGFAMPKPAMDAGDTYLAGAGRAQNHNGWYVHNNSWGTNGLTYGTDFTIDSTFNKNDVTAGTTFTWSMPYTTEVNPRVLAYPEVAFGVSPMGNYAANPGDKAAVFPVKVADLVSMTASYDVSYAGNTGGFNVAYDIWLTSKPNGDRSTITNEVMVWVHKGDFAAFGTLVGTYQDGDFTAKIYHQGTYTAIVADRDVPVGELDIAKILDKLESLGIVSSSEYLASVELGAEVVSGVGSLTVNNLDLHVKTTDALGNIVLKDVTGSGTAVTSEPALTSAVLTSGVEAKLGAHGVRIGTEETIANGSTAVVKHLDGNGALMSFDNVLVEKSGAIATHHFTTAGSFIGADVVRTAAAGSVNTEHYDAGWKFTGADNVTTKANGSVLTAHYDAKWAFTGAENQVVEAPGRISTQHYDRNWAFTGADVEVKEKSGTISIQHYDSSWHFTGQDSTVANADGSATTYHYSASWKLDGIDVTRVTQNGIQSTASYDAAWKLSSTEYQGTVRNDAIVGSVMDNDFHGGFGSDVLKGGAGHDEFFFETAIGKDVDSIKSFATAKDTIVLDQSVFGALTPGGLDPNAFVAGKTALDAGDRILFDGATGNLFYDADGAGGAAATLFATLQTDHGLTAANFLVIA